MTLGGFVRKNGNFQKEYFPIVADPTQDQLKDYLEKLANKSGVLALEIDPVPDVGVYELLLDAHNSKYLLMLNSYVETGVLVRTLSDVSKENSLVVFEGSGEKFPNRAITENFDLVAYILMKFLEKGDVSRDLMA